MIRSMTGFARRERQGPWGTLTCELRSVNHRYLELSLRLPEDLRSLENDARQLLSGNAAPRQGRCRPLPARRAGRPRTLELNRPLVEQLRRPRRRGERDGRRHGAAAIDPLDVLRWPGVIRETERDMDAARRGGDGAAARDGGRSERRPRPRGRPHPRDAAPALRGAAQIGRHGARAAARARRAHPRPRAERVAQLGTQVDPERLEQEIALLAYKMDVEEELDRLGSHLTETLQVLDSKEPAGRRLDFLMQEFNREANTLSSKSQDAETTRAAVDMKVLIEQMREQVQNVE